MELTPEQIAAERAQADFIKQREREAKERAKQLKKEQQEAEKRERERLAAERRQRDLEERQKEWARKELEQRVRRANVVPPVGVKPEPGRTDWDPNKKTTSGT